MKWFCFHDWTPWSQLVYTSSGEVYQYSYCRKCNKEKKIKRGYSCDYNLLVWNNPKSEADEKGRGE